MAERSYDVFISYRRESGAAEARLIRAALQERGLRVFLDVADLGKGYFDETLLKQIAETPNFVVVLSPDCLDRCSETDDWLRREIVQAIETHRNIIPVMLPGFKFPAVLDPSIKELPRHQGLEYTHTFFEAMIDRLITSLEETPEPKVERQPRVLEAAAPKQALVGRAMEVLAMVRREDSEGLKSAIDEEQILSLSPDDIRAKPFELEFSRDAMGKAQPAEITLKLDSPDFKPRSQIKKLRVPPEGNSEVCTFLLAPTVGGELVLNLELLKQGELVASRMLRTRAEISEAAIVGGAKIVTSIPLVVLVYESGAKLAYTIPPAEALTQREERPFASPEQGEFNGILRPPNVEKPSPLPREIPERAAGIGRKLRWVSAGLALALVSIGVVGVSWYQMKPRLGGPRVLHYSARPPEHAHLAELPLRTVPFLSDLPPAVPLHLRRARSPGMRGDLASRLATLHNLAREAYSKADYESAIAYARSTLALDPNDAYAKQLLESVMQAAASSLRPLATTAPAAPAGRLLIKSSPPGAQVFLDGKLVGTTGANGELELSELLAGENKLRVTHAGYDDSERTINIISGQHASIPVTLSLLTAANREPPAPAVGTFRVTLDLKGKHCPGELVIGNGTLQFHADSDGCGSFESPLRDITYGTIAKRSLLSTNAFVGGFYLRPQDGKDRDFHSDSTPAILQLLQQLGSSH
jgi:hypothetical protein